MDVPGTVDCTHVRGFRQHEIKRRYNTRRKSTQSDANVLVSVGRWTGFGPWTLDSHRGMIRINEAGLERIDDCHVVRRDALAKAPDLLLKHSVCLSRQTTGL